LTSDSATRPPSARPRKSWAATARQALLYALPLAFVALLAAQWQDADYLAMRESARREAQTAAEALGVAAGNEVAEFSVYAQIAVARAAAEGLEPPKALWRVITSYDMELLVLIREGERTLFPPEDPLASPRMWEEKLRALIGAASLSREGDLVNGWFPEAGGVYYFECRRIGGAPVKETCIALNSKLIFPVMIAALNSRSRVFPGFAFRLRDPFDRTIWKTGEANEAYESFVQSGTLHGWAVDVAGEPPPRRSAFGRLALAAPLAMVWLLLVWQARRADKARLEESAARAALAARLSHDLRTPLANLKLYAELIARRAASVPDVDRYCKVLGEEIDRLDALAGETIYGDRGGAPAPETSVADPCALARRIIDRYGRLMAASGCACELACGTSGTYRFDAGAFERILVNLIDNARKYAPGRIDVAIDWRDGLLALSVRDHGAGAPRGGGASTPSPSHGLGLSIVQELARANGGAFTLSGADPGLCARVTIRAAPEDGK
jgi:signal transduction histidine kinase